jgi:hypothetical protein
MVDPSSSLPNLLVKVREIPLISNNKRSQVIIRRVE